MQNPFFKIQSLIFTAILIFLLICTSCIKEVSNLYPFELKCESGTDPLGIDEMNPRLSWMIKSNEQGDIQTAYQILVATDEELLQANKGDLWNSGKVNSSQILNIDYSGKKLESRMICYWKVRIWDKDRNVSEWSQPAHWEMSLLNQDEWHAKWINDGKEIPSSEELLYDDDSAPLFRKTFESYSSIKRARLYITGLGYYMAYLNGQRIGDHELDPAWTNYSKRVFYSTYDVTEMINQDSNCLGVTLGNGWYNPLPLRMWGQRNLREHLTVGRPAFISQLYIEYTDGAEQFIVSDDSWLVHDGPITHNNIYLGEEYDARLEIPGWNEPTTDVTDWRSVGLAPDPEGILYAQPLPPIKITKRITPVKITESSSGVYIADMGQNFAGTIRIKVSEPAGKKITLRYGELLYEDGTLNPMTSVAGQIKGKRKNDDGETINIGGPGSPEIAWQEDCYIAKGEGVEEYIPHFTFHGFRYVEISGLDSPPDLTRIEGLMMNSNVEPTGSFTCSDTLLNKIQEMCQQTFLSNIFSVQSDCPHREKFGYGGDIAATSESFIFNFDMAQFYQKTVNDWNDATLGNGMFTDTAPFVGIQYCGVAWAMVHPLLQLQLYKYYGNKRIIEEQYAASKRWIDLVISENPDHLIHEGLSDHEGLTENPAEEMITPLYFYSVKTMEALASILDLQEDAQRYDELAQQISSTYCNKFLNKETGKVGPGTQTSQAFALFTGITPPELNEKILDYLIQNIANHNHHLTTGIFGTRYMLDLLSQNGYHDIALHIASQKDFPGWGNMIENGATTLWEHWEFSDNTYSHNHPMFGSISQWFFNHLGGIQIDPEAIGFDRIIIKPEISGPVNWVKCNYKSARGIIVSNWEKTDDGVRMEINIPSNSSSIIYFPAKNLDQIRENGSPLSKIPGITFIGTEGDKVKCHVESGNYLFTIRLTD